MRHQRRSRGLGTTTNRDAEVLAAAHAMDLVQQRAQADSLERPLRRRDDRIERPARVRMRRRKPCFLARRRLFGWYVRLLTGLPHESGGDAWFDVSGSTVSAGRPLMRACRRPPLAHRFGLRCGHAAGVALMTTPRYGGADRRSNRPSYDLERASSRRHAEPVHPDGDIRLNWHGPAASVAAVFDFSTAGPTLTRRCTLCG